MLSSRVPMVFEMMSVLFLLVVCMIAGKSTRNSVEQRVNETCISMATCLHINLIFTGVYSVDLTPVKPTENSLDGTTVTLSHRLHKKIAGGDDFFWYRQYPGEPPQFLLSISGLGFNKTAESLGSDKRFSTELTEEKTGVDLTISSAAVTDSALYYCALRPT